jgi:hypothetical protein
MVSCRLGGGRNLLIGGERGKGTWPHRRFTNYPSSAGPRGNFELVRRGLRQSHNLVQLCRRQHRPEQRQHHDDQKLLLGAVSGFPRGVPDNSYASDRPTRYLTFMRLNQHESGAPTSRSSTGTLRRPSTSTFLHPGRVKLRSPQRSRLLLAHPSSPVPTREERSRFQCQVSPSKRRLELPLLRLQAPNLTPLCC